MYMFFFSFFFNLMLYFSFVVAEIYYFSSCNRNTAAHAINLLTYNKIRLVFKKRNLNLDFLFV